MKFQKNDRVQLTRDYHVKKGTIPEGVQVLSEKYYLKYSVMKWTLGSRLQALKSLNPT